MDRILRKRKLFAAHYAVIERPFRRTAAGADAGSIPSMKLNRARHPQYRGALDGGLLTFPLCQGLR
jgi:hypothetical protein